MPTKGLIFISYRRDDSSDVTGRIYDRLVKAFGRSAIFKDVNDIRLGADFRERVADEISQCQVLLAVIGPGWLNATDAMATVVLRIRRILSGSKLSRLCSRSVTWCRCW